VAVDQAVDALASFRITDIRSALYVDIQALVVDAVIIGAQVHIITLVR